MARNTPGAGSDYIAKTVPFTSLADFSVSFWIAIDTTQSANNRAWKFGAGTRGVGMGFQIAEAAIQVVDQGVAWRGGYVSLDTTLRHVGLTRAASGNWLMYTAGALHATLGAGPNTPDSADTLTIGGSDEAAYSLDGTMAEFGCWNVGLSADEMASLGKGFSPLLIRPQSLASYVPIFGNNSPEPDRRGPAYTVTGSSAKVSHPRVIMPREAIYLP